MTYLPTVQRVSQLILLCVAPCDEDIIMFLRDLTQAYTQSAKRIITRIFIEHPTSLNLDPAKILKVIRPLYGLPDRGLYRFGTYQSNHTEKLKMKHAIRDMCFLLTRDIFSTAHVKGATNVQTDDKNNIGTKEFIELEKKCEKFETKANLDN